MENFDEKTFHLGLTMGGAVSAGAYTGGVMDYIFQALDNWEKAKKGQLSNINEKLVPKHNVVIDAMGGTSAGGMATVMSALYGLQKERNPIIGEKVKQVRKRHGNVLYDSWVMLSENEKGENLVLDQALSTKDLEDGKIKSLINSDFIDAIAKNAFETDRPVNDEPDKYTPPYLSKDLELLLSHSMLRGIPLEVSFPNGDATRQENPSHVSYEHFLFSHFKLTKNDKIDLKKYLALNPYNPEHRKRMLDATIATGAFPLGLRYRHFDKTHFNSDYLKSVVSRLVTGEIGIESPEIKGKIDWNSEPLKTIINEYGSLTVDGGAINNEPYFEIYKILEGKYKKPSYSNENNNYHKYGVVMIDPFPDFPNKDEEYETPSMIEKVLKKIILMLWDQSKVKRREMVQQFSKNELFRGYVYPSKGYWDSNGEWKKNKTPIASASLGAFGGFLDIRFRHHDFHLGRDNARNYIRAFLSLRYYEEKEKRHPIHRDWTEEMVDRFKVKLDGKYYLPIIPDMELIRTDVDIRPTVEEARKYTIPEIPKIDPKTLDNHKSKIRKRLRGLMKIIFKRSLCSATDSILGRNKYSEKKEDQECSFPKKKSFWLNFLEYVKIIFLAILTLITFVIAFPFLYLVYWVAIFFGTRKIINIVKKDLCKKELLAT